MQGTKLPITFNKFGAMAKQAWIKNASYDGILILAAPFLCLGLVMAFPNLFQNTQETGIIAWFILVVLVDVSHVYSTLYRTYFDPASKSKQGKLYRIIPVLSLVIGILLYGISSSLFWTLLAYLAVYHFIRQQYGFMRIYSRYETNTSFKRKLDAWVVYTLCIYPLLVWHLKADRQFNWFIQGDFFLLPNLRSVLPFFQGLYLLSIGIYLISEIRTKRLNIPKNLIMAGTGLSWYMGIVYYNADITFTLFNVLAHGIPYLGLIWIDGIKKRERNYFQEKSFLNRVFQLKGLWIFLFLLAFAAYFEEYLWDILVWSEHPEIFPGSGHFQLTKNWLGIIIPLLSVPQITHYVLDAFIWKIQSDTTGWKDTTLMQPES